MEEFLFEADTELKLDRGSKYRLRHSPTDFFFFASSFFLFISRWAVVSPVQERESWLTRDTSLLT